jgi:protein phosphatase
LAAEGCATTPGALSLLRRTFAEEIDLKAYLKPTPPRDVIGDVEGCYYELLALLQKLGYQLVLSSEPLPKILRLRRPGKRKLVFAGDMMNRGPHSDLVINLVMQLAKRKCAIVVKGNQELKYLKGTNPEAFPTIAAVARHGEKFASEVSAFLSGLPSKYETNRLIVVHAAYREDVAEDVAEKLALFGEKDGTVNKHGFPVHLDIWEPDYRGTKTIVHGHTPLRDVHRRDFPSGARVVNVDTGAAFGNKLSALRFPTLEVVSVSSLATYSKPVEDW